MLDFHPLIFKLKRVFQQLCMVEQAINAYQHK